MKNPFVILLMIVDVMASVWYLAGGEWWKAVYWVAAAVLSMSIYFM